MGGKRELLANFCERSRLTSLLARLSRSPRLFSLNLHRIGDSAATPYDPGVFSCTAAEFDKYLGWLKAHFPILSLPETEDIIHGRQSLRGPALFLTFDDGYLDNYELAFPILQSHGLSAAFFLPTAFVGTGVYPWWDSIAYIVKNSRLPEIKLQLSETHTFTLAADRSDVIRRVLNLYKRPEITDTETFLAALEEACDTSRPNAQSGRAFLNWDEAREMQSAGMSIGSHTHTHPILSKLSLAAQLSELKTSRDILTKQMGQEITSLAYPVGSLTAFHQDTMRAAAEAGYQTAYSFYGGVNTPGAINPFDVRRSTLDNEPSSMVHLRAASLAAFGRALA